MDKILQEIAEQRLAFLFLGVGVSLHALLPFSEQR
jgi:hypothetical protein